MSEQYTVIATKRCQEVLEAAAHHAEVEGEDRVSIWHLAEALLENRSCGVMMVCRGLGIDQEAALEKLEQFKSKDIRIRNNTEELVAAVERLTQRIRKDLRKGKSTDAVESVPTD